MRAVSSVAMFVSAVYYVTAFKCIYIQGKDGFSAVLKEDIPIPGAMRFS